MRLSLPSRFRLLYTSQNQINNGRNVRAIEGGSMLEVESGTGMIYRVLGSTGARVSAIGVGGWHLGLKHVDEKLSIRIVRTAIDRGINFLDNSWDYNEGASEVRMGKALRDGYLGSGVRGQGSGVRRSCGPSR